MLTGSGPVTQRAFDRPLGFHFQTSHERNSLIADPSSAIRDQPSLSGSGSSWHSQKGTPVSLATRCITAFLSSSRDEGTNSGSEGLVSILTKNLLQYNIFQVNKRLASEPSTLSSRNAALLPTPHLNQTTSQEGYGRHFKSVPGNGEGSGQRRR